MYIYIYTLYIYSIYIIIYIYILLLLLLLLLLQSTGLVTSCFPKSMRFPCGEIDARGSQQGHIN